MSNENKITQHWRIPSDSYLKNLKHNWFNETQKLYTAKQSLSVLDEWFRSTKLNTLHGWERMPYVDITMGCAHYIESFIIGQHGLDNFQILTDEYAYYSFLGKWGTPAGQLEKNKPLIITLPHYKWGGLRPEWDDVLAECESKNIEIHIDMAWLTMSRDIEIDLDHPAIRSIGVGLSKMDCQWNRVGLRYTKQRQMDSITIFNKFYIHAVNENIYSGGAYIANNIDRDYWWNNYQLKNNEIANEYNLQQTKLIHGLKDNDTVYCITDLLTAT